MQCTPKKMAVMEFVNAIRTWVEESLLKRLHKALFSIMADECTDVTAIEELTICCRWVESGVPEEHFIEILPMKKANWKYLFYISGLLQGKEHSSWKRVIGMGFDGAVTLSGDKTRVQRRLDELSPHVLFVHYRWHVLQLVSVQAANATPDIKHVYTILMNMEVFSLLRKMYRA